MTSHIPNTQTLCLKGVPMAHAKAVVAAVEREARPTHGITHTPDKEPGRGSECLVYANYASARDAQRARVGVEAWVRDKWPEQWGRRPQVLLKAELQEVYFALYVDGAPPGTQPRELEAVFAQYGQLHATKICAIKSSDNAYFVNYCHYESALAALEAARCRTLRFKGAILYTNAARNTTFLAQLTADLRASGRFSFSLDDAKRVGKNMGKNDWPPPESSIEKLLTAARQHFVPDRKAKQFHLMDQNAPLAPAPAQTPPVSQTPLVSPTRSPSPAGSPSSSCDGDADRFLPADDSLSACSSAATECNAVHVPSPLPLCMLTAATLRAAGLGGPLHARDDDGSSVTSMATTFSGVSVNKGLHAGLRAVERQISDREVQQAKARGSISLAVLCNSDEDMRLSKDEIRGWGAQLVEAFGGMTLGEPQTRGNSSHRRAELELAGSESKGPRIKQWLEGAGYFGPHLNRMIYVQRQERDQELVVVEGRSGVTVGIITMFERETDKVDTAQAEIGKPLLRLISGLHPHEARAIDDGDDVGLLDELLERSARLADDGATWLVGPGHKLSEWPIAIDGHLPVHMRMPADKRISYPLLMWAAQLGRARIVEHLVHRYGCSVHVEQTVEGEGKGVTALHLAAYHGHVDVVRILLRAGASSKKASKEGFHSDRYPIDSAKSGKELYERNPSKPSKLFPSLYVGDTNVLSSACSWTYLHAVNVRVDLRVGANWPQFDEIIGLLQAPAGGCAAGAGIQHRGAADDVRSWGVEQVLAFFERCKFPTEGVLSGEVDGESLINLYQDPDAESLFTVPAPDGLGFNKLMFKGRFKKEMEKLVAKPSVFAYI